jgi:type IV secretion system protein VirB6
MLFFDATKRMFAAWVAQLANYALITVLTVMIAALLLQLVQTFASQTAARGGNILTMDALNMVLVAVLVFLILRQIMPIAGALSGGMALASFGLVSRSIGWARQRGSAVASPVAGFAARKLLQIPLGMPVRVAKPPPSEPLTDGDRE